MGVRENVEWKMSADAAEVVRAWQQITAAQEKNLEALKKLGTEGRKAGEESAKGWRDSFQSMIGFGSGAAVAEKALEKLTQSFAELAAMQRRAADLQVDEASARRALTLNLAATPADERAKFVSGLEGVADRTHVNRRDIFQAGSEAASARGNLSLDDALAAVELSARARPDDPETMRAMAKGLLDTSHVTGSANPQENFGFLLNALDPSRIEQSVRFGMNMIPAMTASREFGNSAEQARAMGAAISSQLVDTTGEKSKTAMIQLDSGLAEFFKGKPELADSQARMEYLQAHPELHGAFKKKFTSDTSTEPILERMATDGSSEGMGVYKSALELPDVAAGAARAEELIAELESDPKQQTANFSRGVQSILDTMLADDSASGMEAEYAKALSTLSATMPGNWKRSGAGMYDYYRVGGASQFEAFESGVGQIRESVEHEWFPTGGEEKRQKNLEVLDKILEEMRKLNEAQTKPKEITLRESLGHSQAATVRESLSLMNDR